MDQSSTLGSGCLLIGRLTIQKPTVPILFIMRKDNQLMSAGAFRLWRANSRFFFLERSTLEFLAEGVSDYNTILISPSCEVGEISKLFCSYLLLHSPRCDRVVLSQIRSGSRTCQILSGLGVRMHVSNDSTTPYLSLSRSWRDQTAKLGRNLRYNIERYGRKLKKDYPDMEIVASREPSDAEMEAFFDLHQMRMALLHKKTTLILPANKKFHKQFVHCASKNSWIRLFELKVRGEIVAALYGFVFKNRFCFYNQGFHPEFARYSPATLLVAESIHTSIEEGLAEFDFLRGNEPYKFHWTQNARINQKLQMTSRRPISILRKSVSMLRSVRQEIIRVHS